MVAGSAARPRLSRQPQSAMYCVPARVRASGWGEVGGVRFGEGAAATATTGTAAPAAAAAAAAQHKSAAASLTIIDQLGRQDASGGGDLKQKGQATAAGVGRNLSSGGGGREGHYLSGMATRQELLPSKECTARPSQQAGRKLKHRGTAHTSAM